jgi:hypothetical protein
MLGGVGSFLLFLLCSMFSFYRVGSFVAAGGLCAVMNLVKPLYAGVCLVMLLERSKKMLISFFSCIIWLVSVLFFFLYSTDCVEAFFSSAREVSRLWGQYFVNYSLLSVYAKLAASPDYEMLSRAAGKPPVFVQNIGNLSPLSMVMIFSRMSGLFVAAMLFYRIIKSPSANSCLFFRLATLSVIIMPVCWDHYFLVLVPLVIVEYFHKNPSFFVVATLVLLLHLYHINVTRALFMSFAPGPHQIPFFLRVVSCVPTALVVGVLWVVSSPKKISDH